MSAVIVHEVKAIAVGRRTDEQVRRWWLYLSRAERSGRVTVHGPVALVGNDWRIECEDEWHADWLVSWLVDWCGFGPTMVKIVK